MYQDNERLLQLYLADSSYSVLPVVYPCGPQLCQPNLAPNSASDWLTADYRGWSYPQVFGLRSVLGVEGNIIRPSSNPPLKEACISA